MRKGRMSVFEKYKFVLKQVHPHTKNPNYLKNIVFKCNYLKIPKTKKVECTHHLRI